MHKLILFNIITKVQCRQYNRRNITKLRYCVKYIVTALINEQNANKYRYCRNDITQYFFPLLIDKLIKTYNMLTSHDKSKHLKLTNSLIMLQEKSKQLKMTGEVYPFYSHLWLQGWNACGSIDSGNISHVCDQNLKIIKLNIS